MRRCTYFADYEANWVCRHRPLRVLEAVFASLQRLIMIAIDVVCKGRHHSRDQNASSEASGTGSSLIGFDSNYFVGASDCSEDICLCNSVGPCEPVAHIFPRASRWPHHLSHRALACTCTFTNWSTCSRIYRSTITYPLMRSPISFADFRHQ